MLAHGGLIGASGVADAGVAGVAFDVTANGFTIAYVTDGSSNTTIVGNVPTNAVNGDLLIAIAGAQAGTNPATITPPAGWTTILTNSAENGQWTKPFHISYRIASSEPANYTWTLTSDGLDDFVAIHRVTGAYTSSPVSGTPAWDYMDASADAFGPSITTAHANALAVFGFVVGNGYELAAADSNYPSGTTGLYARASRASSGGICHGLATLLVASAGATGVKTFTDCIGTTGYSAGFSFALRPA